VGYAEEAMAELHGVRLSNVDDVRPLEHVSIASTLDRVRVEVLNQDTLARSGRFGGTHILPSGPNVARLAVLAEEFGEVSREVTEELMGSGVTKNLIKELIQTAAVCTAWATALENDE
jgi:hypothetical protein